MESENGMSEKMKLRAGPPRCPDCDSIMEAWTRKFKPFNGIEGLLWVCPKFCNIQKRESKTDV